MRQIIHFFFSLRRWVLSKFVPEFVWPRSVVLSGVEIPVRGQKTSFGVKYLLVRGLYESDERALIDRFIQPGDVVIELGASIGVITQILASRIVPSGCIVAVEADDLLASYAVERLRNIEHCHILQGFAFPLWDASSISVTGFDKTLGSLGGIVSFDAMEGVSADSLNNVIDLAAVCDQFAIEPTVLVCDIEGAESVLADYPLAWPESLQNILIEIHGHLLADGEAGVERIVISIVEAGFELKAVNGMNYWFSRSVA